MDGIDLARRFVHYPWTDAICLVSRSRREITFVSMGNEFIQLLYLTDTTPSDIVVCSSYNLYCEQSLSYFVVSVSFITPFEK